MLVGLVSGGAVIGGTTNTGNPAAVIVSLEGAAEVLRLGVKEWEAAGTGTTLAVGDQMRTGQRSRATLRLSNLSVLRVGELMEYEIEPPRTAAGKPTLSLKTGSAYFFSRDKPQEVRLRTPTVSGAIRGTEFNVTVLPGGFTTVTMIDGEVELSNTFGTNFVYAGEQGEVRPGFAPGKTAVLNAVNVIQWALYYPAVLDPSELELNLEGREALGESLAAYQAGDLPAALRKYPAGRQPASAPDHIYLGSLLLSVGLVDQCERQLDAAVPVTDRAAHLAGALRQMIAAVKLEQSTPAHSPELATEWLAGSYYQQSRECLPEALAAARAAVQKSPAFGFALARVAELEFSFSRTKEALADLDRSLAQSPRNAQAVALKGFLLSARNSIGEALKTFDQAIAFDGALSTAWLGRGLCHIRLGQAEAGREDLETAAALEPNRAVLRSYLGKAFSETHDDVRAGHELELARTFDPNDPTSWLYSALLHQQQNRVNEAIRDLEQSQALNDNRSVYRSRLLLDQDAAVRGANLAGIYQDAGMNDVSVREATRAVNYDYVNYSAHLFLANSYNQLRDPQQVNLRYETPWLSEYLLANLLSPVGAGTLSQTVSQQEYSKLFEHDRFGLVSSTEYYSRGAWVQSGSQYGNFGNFGYAVDTLYRSDPGQRPNNDQDQLTLSAQLKYDLTPQDSVFFQTIYYNASAGDLTQYYDQRSASLGLRTKETQEPLLLAGYHHAWTPELHTLLLVGRFVDEFQLNDPAQPVLMMGRNNAGQIIALPTPALPIAPLDYDSRLEIYSVEAQQIWKHERHTLVAGGRYQTGWFNTQAALGPSTPTRFASLTATSFWAFGSSPISQQAKVDFERLTAYGYYNWQIFDPLLLSAGVAYDYLRFPVNYRTVPISSGQDSEDQVSPKAGLIYTPWRDSHVRFAYTRSLGGVSFDQSVRLEPSQVAGFNQAFRSLIPESVAGSTSGARDTTYGLALEQNFKTGTYLGVELGLLESDVHQTIGAADLKFVPWPVTSASGTPQNLDYREKDLVVTVNQLLGDCWSLGARYQLSRAELGVVYPEIPDSVTSANRIQNDATLQQLSLFTLFNHPSGFFARGEAVWYSQDNQGYQPALPGDDFWQFNLSAGWRFAHRRAQVQVGVLNLTGQDYRLNPLNLYPDLPRQRTFVASLLFNF